MNLIDKIFTLLMLFCVASAILCLVTYISYNLFNIGFEYSSFVFLICAMGGACSMMIMIALFSNLLLSSEADK